MSYFIFTLIAKMGTLFLDIIELDFHGFLLGFRCRRKFEYRACWLRGLRSEIELSRYGLSMIYARFLLIFYQILKTNSELSSSAFEVQFRCRPCNHNMSLSIYKKGYLTPVRGIIFRLIFPNRHYPVQADPIVFDALKWTCLQFFLECLLSEIGDSK